jgi:hypothetical protein
MQTTKIIAEFRIMQELVYALQSGDVSDLSAFNEDMLDKEVGYWLSEAEAEVGDGFAGIIWEVQDDEERFAQCDFTKLYGSCVEVNLFAIVQA